MTPEEEEADFRALEAEAARNCAALAARPRWRPHTEPVPQDDVYRWALLEVPMSEGGLWLRSAPAAELLRDSLALRWCWADAGRASLGRGA